MVFFLTLALAVLYLLLFSCFVLGLRKLHYHRTTTHEPTVSVIVAARNEEHAIRRSLESLAKVDYPSDKLEVILVDDQSSDRTYEMMEAFASQHPCFKPVQVTSQTDHLRGKANAIALGIEHSQGELIFLTDADCVIPESWVRTTVNHYTDEVGLIASFTLLDIGDWFGGMQSLDWAFLHTLAAGGVGLKRPLSCFGNNLTFRRRAYEEVGGFRKIPFSVTEDFALFTAITRGTSWGYRYLLTSETLIMSQPCSTLRELFFQKRRWVIGGLEMKLKGFLLMGLGWSLNALLLATLFLGFPLILILSVWVPKVAIDALLLTIPLRRLQRLSLLKFFPVFEVYYFTYVLTLPFLALIGKKVLWKGREF